MGEVFTRQLCDEGRERNEQSRPPKKKGRKKPKSGAFFFKQKTAYEMLRSLVGSEMCIRDSCMRSHAPSMGTDATIAQRGM